MSIMLVWKYLLQENEDLKDDKATLKDWNFVREDNFEFLLNFAITFQF
jgi:biotin synthase-like enzyme